MSNILKTYFGSNKRGLSDKSIDGDEQKNLKKSALIHY